ncbi:MAG: CRISPR-associated helicase Cas3' [bacterium]
MKNLYSHYSARNKKKLEIHLKNVAEKSKEIIKGKQLNLSIIEKSDLADLSYFIGLVHDFGKSTTFFQDYLIKGEGDGPSHHGFISAILAYLMIEKKYDKKIAMVAYMVVKRHHGNLESPLDESEETFFHTRYQIRNIKSNTIDQVKNIYNKLLANTEYDIEILLDELETFILGKDNLSEYFREIVIFNLYDEENKNKAVELFLLTNLLYSVLIDIDKKDAARVNNDYFDGATEKEIDVLSYIEKCRKEKPNKFDPKKPLNKARNEFFNGVINNPKLQIDNYLYNLTAPTGIGKTFTSFAFANKLRKLSSKGKRIIYCLPYTSIIDQNYDEFEKIIRFNYENIYRQSPTKYLLRHHYLTPMKFEQNISIQKDSNESKNLNNYLDEKLLLESWESGNIVTTFVQLLESIIGNKNSYLKKFHNIVNSVIILDEVQNIPVDYYKLVGKVLKILGNKFNTHILLMTATQPEIISGQGVIELIDNDYENKEIFDRVDLKIIDQLKPYNIEEFIDYLDYNFDSDSGLIVCNTVESALNIYDCVNNIFDDFQVFSLTTNLTPKDRENKIKNINKKIKNGEKVIVISTQLIEAGVDLSFEEVYRDFGPLDSIIQVAGRCNRNRELEKKGKVNIIKLENEDKDKFCEKVYDKTLLDICEDILEEDRDFVELSQKYFSSIRKEYKRTSSKILEAIYNLNYSLEKEDQTPIKKFELIEERDGKVDIIICQNKDVEGRIEELKKVYDEIRHINNNREKLNKLIGKKELINKELAQFRISVYKNQLDQYYQDYKIIKEFRFIKYVNYKDQKEYLYDNEIGFLKEPKKPPQTALFV